MKNGTVKWFNAKKGYGFITPDDGSNELFVHYSGLNMEGFKVLHEGDRVTFEIEDNEKGPIAKNVSKI